MKRKQPSRSKRQPSRRERRAAELQKEREAQAQSPPKEVEPREEPERDDESVEAAAVHSDRRLPISLAVNALLLSGIIVFGGLIILQLSLRWRTAAWPTTGDVGLQLLEGASGAALLLASAVAAWFARRLAVSGRAGSCRAAVVVALMCAGVFLGLRVREYRELYARGLWQRSVAAPIYERADTYYVQAVRFRLDDLFRTLDDRRVQKPNEFTDEDAQKLEVVSHLKKNMVEWTEQEVGHWLDDVQSRSDVMKLVAYQVYPLARMQADVETSVQERRRYLDQQRQWFEVMDDYCARKLELLGELSSDSRTNKTSDAEAEPSSSATDGDSPEDELAALDDELASRLAALGLAAWDYAKFVREDTTDIAMAGERSNQVSARLRAIDARAAFLDQWEELFSGDVPNGGLNQQYHWLRLPVCLPGGNAWAGGFFALTGLHALLVVCAMMLSLGALVTRFEPARCARRCRAHWWTAASLVGIAIFLLFYLL